MDIMNRNEWNDNESVPHPKIEGPVPFKCLFQISHSHSYHILNKTPTPHPANNNNNSNNKTSP